MRAAAPRFVLADCEPPNLSEVELVAGMDVLEMDSVAMERAA